MTVGLCPDCGETVVRGGGALPASSAQTARLPVVTVTAHLALPAPFQQAAAARTSNVKPPVLTDVTGIGPARAEQLSQAGIKTVQALAAAEPARVSVALRGVTVESAKVLVSHAEKLLP